MLGEKEEIQRIKNSLNTGKSKEQITKSLMARGYKYDYASLLVKKSTLQLRLLTWIFISLVVLGLGSWAIYGNFFATKNIQLNLINPLTGISLSNSLSSANPDNSQEKQISEIEVTPEFITYLLSLIEAQNYLHKTPLTNNRPIINFKTEMQEFNSIIDKDIETKEGLNSNADLEFYIPREIIILTAASENPKEFFINKVASGEVQIETLASETELFSKGYLKFYNSLTKE